MINVIDMFFVCIYAKISTIANIPTSAVGWRG